MRRRKAWWHWENWSLTARLMAGSSAALVISAAALVYTSLQTEIGATRKMLEDRLNDEVDFLLPTITEQAVIGDYTNIERLLKVRVKRDEIDKFSWTDEKGNKIEAVSTARFKEAPRWFIDWVNIPPLARSHEVIVGGVRYGTVSFELTPMPAIEDLWVGLQDKLQIFILGIGIFFAVIIQILTSGLQPLYRLASGARRFGQGDYSVRIPAEGAPEMQESIKAFNNMADSIGQLVTSLRQSEGRKRLLAIIVEQSDQAIFTTSLDGAGTPARKSCLAIPQKRPSAGNMQSSFPAKTVLASIRRKESARARSSPARLAWSPGAAPSSISRFRRRRCSMTVARTREKSPSPGTSPNAGAPGNSCCSR